MAMPVSLQPPTQPDDPNYRLTVEQYHEMLRNGTIRPGSAVELLEGVLFRILGRNPPHRASTYRTTKALERVVPPGWHVDRQEPMTTDDSEPEPDVYVARGDTRDYLDRHPGPADCALVVGVADCTLAHDRGIKRRLYARAGVPVCWIVANPERAVAVCTAASGPAYLTVARLAEGEHVPVVIDGRDVGAVAMVDLLP
jgi:Uma2 family endonuclease